MPRLNFGAFLAPHHPVGEHPMLQFRRDLDLVEQLDRLGYDEFWCGEHHSSGWEMIGSPEMFLAAAGERSKRIKLATGVISLPYHHPFNVAQRMVQLDWMTGGRAIFGSADEIPEPNDLVVRFWNDGQLRHNYNTDDMEHRVPALIEFASTIMTLNTGDLIACGTNHEGLGALQDGETVEIEIERIGRMSLKVADPLKRSWERGIYMGADSTNPEAVRRHRPQHSD
jgi:alkanesulfonate monooxygenase SsuD/methylene tetrahydromethanopterin reductase-like flavin-dependent oxidoreductase (luciferase family)